MAGDPAEPGGEGATPQDPPEPQDPKAGEGAKPQDPGAGEGKGDQNVHKLERDVANRDKRIKELEAAGGRKTSEDRIDAIEKQLADMEAERDAAKEDAALTAAGCIDCELARPALAALGGDVAALKEQKPYLFAQPAQPGSTGGKPAGAPKLTKEQILDVKDPAERRRLIAENRSLFGI